MPCRQRVRPWCLLTSAERELLGVSCLSWPLFPSHDTKLVSPGVHVALPSWGWSLRGLSPR